jgi:hypothetical protein
MKRALLMVAALLVLGSPASAQMGFSSGFRGGMSGGGHDGAGDGFVGRPAPSHMGRSSHARFGYGYYGYSDVGTNDAFDPGQFNDWWHDRPDRAYPRWVWHNQNCTPDRMWGSGAGWRCTP